MSFLPVDRMDLGRLGVDRPDFLFIIGIISRLDLDNREQSLNVMGCPQYAVLISQGVVDFTVNNYTAAKRPLNDDRCAPEKRSTVRSGCVVILYSGAVRSVFRDVPIIIAGIESSLCRFAHYDYWDNKVRRSVLMDSQADLLYGMRERILSAICNFLSRGVAIKSLTTLAGICVLTTKEQRNFVENNESWHFLKNKVTVKTASTDPTGFNLQVDYALPQDKKHMLLTSFKEVRTSKTASCSTFKAQYLEQDPHNGKISDLDYIYDLPYNRKPHPIYEYQGGERL